MTKKYNGPTFEWPAVPKGLIKEFYKDSRGWNCVHAEVFQSNVKNWKKLSKKRKEACENFVKDMNKKYGKGNHQYIIPE